jgi:hypothetical protein
VGGIMMQLIFSSMIARSIGTFVLLAGWVGVIAGRLDAQQFTMFLILLVPFLIFTEAILLCAYILFSKIKQIIGGRG